MILILYAAITINKCTHSPYQRLTSKENKFCALNSLSMSIWGLFFLRLNTGLSKSITKEKVKKKTTKNANFP